MTPEKMRSIVHESFMNAKNPPLESSQILEGAKLVDDLGFDSLDAMDLIFDLEQRLKIEISTEEARGMITVGDVLRLIETKRLCERNPDTRTGGAS